VYQGTASLGEYYIICRGFAELDKLYPSYLLSGRAVYGLPGQNTVGLACRVQQTSVHRVVVEALLIAIFLPEERADSYRHKEIWSADRPAYSVSFSWSCLAEPSLV
jgi:hypothetical protein